MLLLSHLQALSTLATVLGFLVSLVIKWQGFHRRRRKALFATFFLCWLLSSHGSLNTCEKSKVRWRSGFGVVYGSELPPRFVVGPNVCCGFAANFLSPRAESFCIQWLEEIERSVCAVHTQRCVQIRGLLYGVASNWGQSEEEWKEPRIESDGKK